MPPTLKPGLAQVLTGNLSMMKHGKEKRGKGSKEGEMEKGGSLVVGKKPKRHSSIQKKTHRSDFVFI